MISVGIDVSKGKSTVCAIKPYGEVLMTPRDFKHTKGDIRIEITDSVSDEFLLRIIKAVYYYVLKNREII